MISLRHAPPTGEQIVRWSLDNPGVRFEYVNGEITVSPTSVLSGKRSSALTLVLLPGRERTATTRLDRAR